MSSPRWFHPLPGDMMTFQNLSEPVMRMMKMIKDDENGIFHRQSSAFVTGIRFGQVLSFKFFLFPVAFSLCASVTFFFMACCLLPVACLLPSARFPPCAGPGRAPYYPCFAIIHDTTIIIRIHRGY